MGTHRRSQAQRNTARLTPEAATLLNRQHVVRLQARFNSADAGRAHYPVAVLVAFFDLCLGALRAVYGSGAARQPILNRAVMIYRRGGALEGLQAALLCSPEHMSILSRHLDACGALPLTVTGPGGVLSLRLYAKGGNAAAHGLLRTSRDALVGLRTPGGIGALLEPSDVEGLLLAGAGFPGVKAVFGMAVSGPVPGHQQPAGCPDEVLAVATLTAKQSHAGSGCFVIEGPGGARCMGAGTAHWRSMHVTQLPVAAAGLPGLCSGPGVSYVAARA